MVFNEWVNESASSRGSRSRRRKKGKIKKRGPFTLDRRDTRRDATLRTVKVRRGTGGNGKQREK